MGDTLIQTTKFYLIYRDRPDLSYAQLQQIFFELQRNVRTVKNRASSQYFSYLLAAEDYRAQHGEWPKNTQLGLPASGRDFQSSIYHQFKDTLLKPLNTGCVDAIAADVMNYFEGNHNTRKKELLAGRASIPSYGSDQPIPFRKQGVHLSKEGGSILLTLSMFSKSGVKDYDLKGGSRAGMLTFELWHKCDSSVEIVRRCLSGEHRHSSGTLSYDSGKRMFEFALQYELPKPERELDPGKLLGIDLGIALPVAMAVGGEETRYFIRGAEVEEFRRRIEARRRDIQRARPYAGSGSVGHGRDTRVKPVDKLSLRIRNFRETKNHAWSREIVNIARKNGCGTIQMENLSGISAGKQPRFLKDWTYYDLQNKIRYKAQAEGIRVVLVDPGYTSQRCSCCGFIDAGNRPKAERGQAYFKCLQCGYEANADYNAARNLATPEIEEQIARQLRAQTADAA